MSVVVQNLCFSYGKEPVLEDVSFRAERGEFWSVLGPNGAGKSTLFRCMLGLLRPSSGSIFIEDAPIFSLSAKRLARKIAYIPQSHSPSFNFSVLDMVLMGTTAVLGTFESPRQKHIRLAEDALGQLGISHLRNRGYANISGGERQLVLIARAMAQQARILVMDEPSASLDFGNRLRVMQTVRALTHDGYTVIQSTHDPAEAYQYSDRILALHNGRVLAKGAPTEVITASVISKLYGTAVEVCSIRDDSIRVCFSTEEKR